MEGVFKGTGQFIRYYTAQSISSILFQLNSPSFYWFSLKTKLSPKCSTLPSTPHLVNIPGVNTQI